MSIHPLIHQRTEKALKEILVLNVCGPPDAYAQYPPDGYYFVYHVPYEEDHRYEPFYAHPNMPEHYGERHERNSGCPPCMDYMRYKYPHLFDDVPRSRREMHEAAGRGGYIHPQYPIDEELYRRESHTSSGEKQPKPLSHADWWEYLLKLSSLTEQASSCGTHSEKPCHGTSTEKPHPLPPSEKRNGGPPLTEPNHRPPLTKVCYGPPSVRPFHGTTAAVPNEMIQNGIYNSKSSD